MIEVLKLLETTLKSDSTLVGLLATHNSAPAIFDGEAPSEVSSPYMTIDFVSDPNNVLSDTMDYNIEVIDESLSPAKVLQIAQRIQYLFNQLTPNANLLHIERGAHGKVPDESTEIQHYHLGFEIKYSRKDLF